jgi:hypothetical protein
MLITTSSQACPISISLGSNVILSGGVKIGQKDIILLKIGEKLFLQLN